MFYNISLDYYFRLRQFLNYLNSILFYIVCQMKFMPKKDKKKPAPGPKKFRLGAAGDAKYFEGREGLIC